MNLVGRGAPGQDCAAGKGVSFLWGAARLPQVFPSVSRGGSLRPGHSAGCRGISGRRKLQAKLPLHSEGAQWF